MSAPEILLNIENLYHNTRLLLKKSPHVFAVIKANAYGHGAVMIARMLEKSFSTKEIPYFCLARLGEVQELRYNGINHPCLIFSEWDYKSEEWPDNAFPVIHGFEDIDRLPTATAKFNKIHLKINTGMNRMGWCLKDFSKLEKGIEQIAAKGFLIEGLMSHLARAEEDAEKFSNYQQRKFLETYKVLMNQWKGSWGPKPQWIHLANSEGLFHNIGLGEPFNAVRAGLGLWGVQENSRVPTKNHEIRPVLSLRAPIRKIYEIDEGDGVGYGQVYQAKMKRRLATVNLGYADGLRRDFAKEEFGFGLFYKGRKLPFCGRISMDLCTVDVTDVPCQVGDWLYWICDDQSVEGLASAINTISYEIFCSFHTRIKRKYLESNT
jgi:alanine racemase